MNNEQQMTNDVTLLSVAFNESAGTYTVNLAKGSTLPETAFAMAIVIKCLVKDGVIEDNQVMLDLVDKYLNDPQWDEVKDDEPQEVEQQD